MTPMQPQSNEHRHPELEQLLGEHEHELLRDFRQRVAQLTEEIRRLTQVPA